ncbi:outer membrane beta-barrel protein [Motiliproteus sediminis]|uniref:outer membrane beta-barrel protein n=1 Tax=Motiliproteus sediminis TaxID=1468178 RepID=UPI001AEF58CB|nr:outer membrane beta-barrel protein [Motiliproteus sediminis]
MTKATYALLGLSFLAAPVHADGVAKINTHYLWNSDEFDDEQSFGVALGYRSAAHAIEVELQINGMDSSRPGFDVDADLITYAVNYDYHFGQGESLSYYAGIGVGYSEPEFYTSASMQGRDSITLWQARLGVEHQLSNRLFVGAELRYQDFGRIEDNGVSFQIGSPLSVGASLGYRF